METTSLQAYLSWFRELLGATIQLYFKQECPFRSIRDIPLPATREESELFGLPENVALSFEERIILVLALVPHLQPQLLDIFFIHNKNFDRPYTEFGGWRGLSHNGFLPTGETAAFILAGEDVEKRNELTGLFSKKHWFYRHNFLRLEGQGPGEPFLSGQLRASEELLSRVIRKQEFKPDYSIDFPAKRLVTSLEWEDLILDYRVMAEIREIDTWIPAHSVIMDHWKLSRFLKDGYRAMFYGPPGTGKTLTASLIGKQNGIDVYRVDLSMIVSKYIGETEKNLARIFDQAENRDWILFFDEADALFGKRTSANTSNDRHANQEVAYLLQRIEDFPGTVLLATNLRSNIDEAFGRRFQNIIYFPMPGIEQRIRLWENMLPETWLTYTPAGFIEQIAEHELSGGSIANVIRRCALQLMSGKKQRITPALITAAIQKELYKEGKL